MNLEIITEELKLDIYGFSGTALNKDYAGTAFKLSDKMWRVVKEIGLKHKGKNIWVYEPDEKVFAGVEMIDLVDSTNELEHKHLVLPKYAYFKHIGPYQLIKQRGQEMINELKSRGFETALPYIEVYGHWTSDENKLETELFMKLR